MRTIFKLVNVFNCVDVLGVSLLEEDRTMTCYEDPQHKKLVAFAVVALVFWVIVLPVIQLVLFFIRRVKILSLMNSGWVRKTLDEERIQEYKNINLQFSVTINGLKPNTFYWD